MNIAKTVTVIPATKNIFTMHSIIQNAKRRVAGYARVSTNNEEQLSSYEAQVNHYSKYIKSKLKWEFVKVYTDEGTSATNTKKRDGFNQMIKDALDGKIDLIVTKSVSRFARNTVDTLTTVRKLKEKGVEVYFEKENIYTLDSKGELLITIMSSLAQEESRSISENVKWGQNKRRQDGKVNLPYKQFLGYEKGDDGQPKIVEKEAKIVRLIYKLFLEGKTFCAISRFLNNSDIFTPSKRGKWAGSTVQSILTNEKYKGDAILQKTFCVDFLTKKMKKNEGELPQFYVENSHPAIISPEIFDMVQNEVTRRKGLGLHSSSAGIFSSKIICADCGNFFGSKVWHSNTKYKRTIWQCNSKFKNKNKCQTPHFSEYEIKTLFLKAFNQIVRDKDKILNDCEIMLMALTNTDELDKKIEAAQSRYDDIQKLLESYINENATSKLDQKEYKAKYSSYLETYEKEKSKLENLQNSKSERKTKIQKIRVFINKLKAQGSIVQEFDEELFFTTVDKITVNPDKTLIFIFKNGIEIILI